MKKAQIQEQIEELISLGKTEEALELLVQLDSDAVMLQSRFRSAKKQFSLGMLDFSERSRIQAQINYAALEMLYRAAAVHKSEDIYDRPEVYLAYNVKDEEKARAVRRYLEHQGITSSVIDYSQINAGQSISDFVLNKALKSQFILVLVSENSLREGWAGLERHLDVFSNSLIQRNVIPLALDDSFANPDFIEKEIRRLEDQVDELDARIQKNLALKLPIQSLESKKADLTVLYNNLPKIVQRLRNALVVDINDDYFAAGMAKVERTIQANAERVASVAY